MADDNEWWGTLSGPEIVEAQRWFSAWGDLLSASWALLLRKDVSADTYGVFHRRALWESAVVSYGRCAVSDQKRSIPFKPLVEETCGQDGLALHERIMDWRHGHIAHRKRAEFESIETVLSYADDSEVPNELHVLVAVDAGPDDDDEFVVAFRRHIKTVSDAIHEKRILPLALSIVKGLNDGSIKFPSELRPAENKSRPGRYVVHSRLGKLNFNPTEVSTE